MDINAKNNIFLVVQFGMDMPQVLGFIDKPSMDTYVNEKLEGKTVVAMFTNVYYLHLKQIVEEVKK